MAGDGPAVKSYHSECITPDGAAGLLNNTRSAPSTEQNSRWMRVRDKVAIKCLKIGELVRATCSLLQKSKLKPESELMFAGKPSLAQLRTKHTQNMWQSSLLRRSAKSVAFSLDHARATKNFKGGWCKATRPLQGSRRVRLTARRVGPKKSAREREVLAWSNLSLTQGAIKQASPKALANLEQHSLRLACQDIESMATLLLIVTCTSVIGTWPGPAQALPLPAARSTACTKWMPPLLLKVPVQQQHHKHHQNAPQKSRPVREPRLGSGSDKQRIELALAQKAARDKHWKLVRRACDSDDHKEFSKDPEWRKELLQAHSSLLKTCDSQHDKLEQATNIIRSMHPGRAQIDVNPTQVAIALQPAVDDGSITQQQADTMVKIATEGISVEEFRDLLGESTDLSAGNTEEPEDEAVLLDFYFSQAARSRVLLFPQEDAELLDSLGSVVLSPSFLHRVAGKNPRPICNLSSNNKNGVNQLVADFEANPDGYTTIPGIAKLIVQSYVSMVTNPADYGIDDVEKISLAMLVADAADAFTRVSVSAKAVGMQCMRIAGITVVPMCCLFGWRRSAEVFSHVTASIMATYIADLQSATFIDKDLIEEWEEKGCWTLSAKFRDLIMDQAPKFPRLIEAHVDDFCVLADTQDRGYIGAAADLIWSIKSHLGAASISVKKFLESSFWSGFQKIIGAWFNVETFTVTMPHNKIQEVIDILESDDFSESATEFEIDICATLRGKLRWALLATKLGDAPALIHIEQQREPGKSNSRKVRPARLHGESQQLSTAKFLNDMRVYKLLMYACRDNPDVATCSLVSLLPLEQRLTVPGQSKWLVWLSGDFSMKAQSFGIELWHPVHGHQKFYSVVHHPQATIDALREALAGRSLKGRAVVSTVCERLNKLMAEFQFRDLLAGRPCIVLEDNQGSVACINSGYSSHELMQAMQLASNLRQAVDEAPMEAHYCNTLNMSWFDRTSRLDKKFTDRMNNELAELGLPTWVEVPPCSQTAQALNQWLPIAFKEKMPLLEELIVSLGGIKARKEVPKVTLNPTDILNPGDCQWQDRILAAAQPIPHYMGSFGPAAYNLNHLKSAGTTMGGAAEPTWTQLRQRNDLAAGDSYIFFDTFHGGCGGSVAAIKAGWFVQSGADCVAEEIEQFETLTGRVSLGDVDIIDNKRVPSVHCWFSCSSCKDFSELGGKAGINGAKGGCHFIHQFEAAKAAGAKVVVIENVDGVARIDGGVALMLLQQNAKAAGYSRFFHKRITFAQFGDPENRSRRVIVAFHDSVKLQRQWTWPMPKTTEWSLDHGHRKCAGEVLQPSTLVPARFWDDRPCYKAETTWKRTDSTRIFTVGYKNKRCRIGTPPKPSHVWLPTGLFPTCLASGNSGLVRTLYLRAMCPLCAGFSAWFDATYTIGGRDRRRKAGKLASQTMPVREVQKGGVRERRPMPSEVLQSKGFPASTPTKSDKVGFRFAGNAVPVNWFTVLLSEVRLHLEEAAVSKALIPRPDQYVTWLEQPLHIHDLDFAAKKYGGRQGVRQTNPSYVHHTKKGHNIVHHKNRDKLSGVPVSVAEWELISEQGVYFKDGRYADSSKVQINMAWNHWRSFCLRFNRPLFLRVDTRAEVVAAFQQAKLFLQYETGLFSLKAESVAQKIWAVGSKHKSEFLEDPFTNNQLLRDALANAVALDDPVKPKIPVSNETLQAMRQRLDLSDRKSFVLWIAVRFAITYLCRISEYAVDGAHTVLWKHLIFYTSNEAVGGRQPIEIKSIADVYRAAELQVIFYSDKTNPRGKHAAGQGKARSFFAIKDLKNTDCIVRDMARLWLVSERVKSYKVFSWAADTQGVTRQLVSDMLKEAAIATGIPGADVSTHSLRRTGLSRLVAKGPLNPNPMPWEIAREFGRWKSDCARRYFWASTELAQNYATAIWASPRFVQVRGGGDVKVMAH